MDILQNQQIEKLYMEMFEKLRIYARCSLNSEALAEEAVQETFRIACQKPDELCNNPNPRGWLVITLKNTIRNIKSNQASTRRIAERYLMTQIKEISFSEDRIALNFLYANLADTEEFQLLKEFAIDGLSHEEMARSRGITVNACKKRVQRAKEKLQRKIKEKNEN